MPEIDKPNLLVVSAHAADFVWRAGGTIASYRQQGSTVMVVCISLGQRGESGELWRRGVTSPEEIESIRRDESEAAAQALGADIEFLGAEDHPLLCERGLIESLTAVVKRCQPHILLTHFETDVHNPDHEAAYQLTRWALRASTVAGVRPELDALEFVPQLFAFESDQSTLDRFTPDVYVDISDVIDAKQAAMACVRSQYQQMYQRYMDRARYRASMMKNTPRAEYAEAFVRLHPFEGKRLPL